MPKSTSSTYSLSKLGLTAQEVSAMQKIAAQAAKNVFQSRIEHKWYVLDINNGPTNGSPGSYDLTSYIVQGDQYNQRNGDQIRVDKIRFQMGTAVNSTATWTNCRVLIVQSKGGALTAGTALVPHNSLTVMYGSPNYANVDVLYDRRYEVDEYNPVRIVEGTVELGDRLIQYPSGSNSAKRPIYVFFLSDAISLAPANQGWLDLHYSDA